MKLYHFPTDYKKDELFSVSCAGQELPAYACDVSAIPFNQVWQGKQRSFSQTEKSAFVVLGNNAETTLKIKPRKKFSTVSVRPLVKNARMEIDGEEATVTFPCAGQYTVEFDDTHCTLAVFINPEKDFAHDRDREDILYFAPGVHYMDERLLLESGQTLFIDEGAVLYGSVNAVGKKNIRMIGYGILDNSRMKRQNVIQSTPSIVEEADKSIGLPLYFDRCENVHVEGITIVNASEWSAKFTGCKNVSVDNIKLIGMWRYNADGCDFCNCINATLKNSFLRTFDDSIVIKGLHTNRETPVENLFIENCVVWCDWGRCFEIGAEGCAPYIKDIVIRDCYFIHGSEIMLDIQLSDSANVSNVLCEKIHIEYDGNEQKPSIESEECTKYPFYGEKHTPRLFGLSSGVTMWSYDPIAGNISDVEFRDIDVSTADGNIPWGGHIASRGEGRIENIVFSNIKVNKKPCNLRDLGLVVEGNVKNVIEK